MQATTLFTVADLEEMPEDGMDRELLHGELIEVPCPTFGHGRVAKKIFLSVEEFAVSKGLGEAFSEVGYNVSCDDRTGLKPDVSFLSAARVRSADSTRSVEGAPDIAFEVISPSERAGDVEAKALAYLETGAKAAVLIYPDLRRARLFLASGEEFALREKDTLRIPSVLPGWELPLAEIFNL